MAAVEVVDVPHPSATVAIAAAVSASVVTVIVFNCVLLLRFSFIAGYGCDVTGWIWSPQVSIRAGRVTVSVVSGGVTRRSV